MLSSLFFRYDNPIQCAITQIKSHLSLSSIHQSSLCSQFSPLICNKGGKTILHNYNYHHPFDYSTEAYSLILFSPESLFSSVHISHSYFSSLSTSSFTSLISSGFHSDECIMSCAFRNISMQTSSANHFFSSFVTNSFQLQSSFLTDSVNVLDGTICPQMSFSSTRYFTVNNNT